MAGNIICMLFYNVKQMQRKMYGYEFDRNQIMRSFIRIHIDFCGLFLCAALCVCVCTQNRVLWYSLPKIGG